MSRNSLCLSSLCVSASIFRPHLLNDNLHTIQTEEPSNEFSLLEQIIGKCIEFNNPGHITFVDFTKAFDNIKLPCLLKLSESFYINKRRINLLKLTYDKSKAYTEIDVGFSRSVNILKSDKQDFFSVILFSILIVQIIFSIWRWMSIGLSIGDQHLNLSYADHVTSLRNSRNDLKSPTDILNKHAGKSELFVCLKSDAWLLIKSTQNFNSESMTN